MTSPPASPQPDILAKYYAVWRDNSLHSITWLLSPDYPAWFERRGLPVLPYHIRVQRANKYRAAAAYWHAKHLEANPVLVEPTV